MFFFKKRRELADKLAKALAEIDNLNQQGESDAKDHRKELEYINNHWQKKYESVCCERDATRRAWDGMVGLLRPALAKAEVWAKGIDKEIAA